MVSPSDDVAASKPTSASDPTVSPPEVPTHETKLPEPLSHTILLRECLDAALDLLSNSNNERLLGIFALLFVGTYLILGRIGLLLIGAALGVILHASWEGPADHQKGHDELSVPKRRRELALEVSKRLLDWPLRTTSLASEDTNDGSLVAAPESLSSSDLEYSTFQPATASALRLLTDAVLKDYVK